MITPEIDPSNDSPIILIRHGLSEMNLKFEKEGHGSDRKTPEYRKFLGDPAMIDSALHPIGVMQSENHQDHVNKVNFKIVYTSPLRRAMQTTLHMFKNHPKKDEI